MAPNGVTQFGSVHSFYFIITEEVHACKTNSKINRRKAHAFETLSHKLLRNIYENLTNNVCNTIQKLWRRS